MKFLRIVLGIDVAMDSIVVSFGTMNNSLQPHVQPPRSFANTVTGHRELHRWAAKLRGKSDAPCICVMEATGVYYESLAHFLHAHGYIVVVLLPNKIYHYAKTRTIKSKTDSIDAIILASYGLERADITPWHPPSPVLMELRTLTRERKSIQTKLTETINQLHALDHAYTCAEWTRIRLQDQHDLFADQVRAIDKQMATVLASDAELDSLVTRIVTIPGVGRLTAVTVVAETQGFALITNHRQLASYAGLDVVHHESGLKSRRGKISKKGNRHIRCAVYMAALSAIRHNPILQEVYRRLTAKKEPKKVSLVAVARKLLVLIHAIWKTGKPFDAQHLQLMNDDAGTTVPALGTEQNICETTPIDTSTKHQTRLSALQVSRARSVKSALTSGVHLLLIERGGTRTCAGGDGAITSDSRTEQISADCPIFC